MTVFEKVCKDEFCSLDELERGEVNVRMMRDVWRFIYTDV